MKLTGFAKAFVTIVIFIVVGLAAWEFQVRRADGARPSGAEPGREGKGTPEAKPMSGSPTSPVNVLASIREKRVLRVGMEPDAPPLHFINENHQEDGFDFRLASRIATRLGAERVQVVEADYAELPARLLAGEFDIIMAGFVPDPDVKGVDWSQGYLDFGLCMIVSRKNVGIYRDLPDLAGKRIAIYDDPAAEKWVSANVPGARIETFSGDSGWFESVASGAADALIYDYPFAAVEIRRHPETAIVKYNLNKSKYAVGVPTNNFDLVYQINQALDEIKESEEYAALMREFLASRSEAFMAPVAGRTTHTVREGDTLSRIAQSQLGAPERWEEIWAVNNDRVADPNLIYPGLVLILP